MSRARPLAGVAIAGIVLGLGALPAVPAQATREPFGQVEGRAVDAVVLRNTAGMRVRLITYGAALQALQVPDRHGKVADVVLSYPDMDGFLRAPQYFGVTVGRYANRIAHGTFTLDGQAFSVPRNDGENSLHGGPGGFDKALWTLAGVHGGARAAATFSLVSPDGDQGFPGELTVSVTYELSERNELAIRYRATTTRPTVVNLTNHSYFNLAGAASGRDVLDARLTILAAQYTPVDARRIPTGERRAVAGTAFDFTSAHRIGERIDGDDPQLVLAHGYDHNWILSDRPRASPTLAARVEDPVSGRVLELLTTEPGVQFYSANFLNGTSAGKEGARYQRRTALCLEPEHFPDSPNHPDFPSTRLDPGQVYTQTSIFRFRVTAPERRRAGPG